MIVEDHLAHYGILRRSGRYPWGSGGNESTRNRSFLDIVEMHRKEGMSEAEIAKGYGISVAQLRAAKSIALAQQKQEKILMAQRLQDKGYSNGAIAERMGLAGESSVRALLAPGAADRADALHTTANLIKSGITKNNYIDVGAGVEAIIGVTETRLKTAVALLQEQGYTLHTIYVPQVNMPGKYTTRKVLALPGTTLAEVNANRQNINLVNGYSEDYGRSFLKTQPPISVNSRRIGINYAEDGGKNADGVIYVRPGVKDLDLGGKNYGQVRIMVDGTHYLKGMAIYKDDLPAGRDLVFNTSKSNTGRKKDAMKPLEDDPDLPFGSIIRQVHDANGKVSSALNIVGSPMKEGSGVEGAWDDWSKTLSSQMLSKQSPALAKSQLNVTYENRVKELNEIRGLTNSAVRKKLLDSFADSTDSAAVHLKAAAMPGQATKVLLPVPSMKPNEIHAPTLKNGDRVALVRYPHGGTFEIPQLTVNNRNPAAKKLIGPHAEDAVGIHHSVAERLSGADFDGDTVILIPNNKGSIKSTPALEGLKGFDPHSYKIPEGSPIPQIKPARKQQEMGKISNLITDMTIHGAKPEELAAAVRHSMVVIDAEKHNLDFKQSEKDNGIANLRRKYQMKESGRAGGAATLLSRAGSEKHIPQRRLRKPREGGPVDLVTGKKVYIDTGKLKPEYKYRVDKETGKKVYYKTGKMIPVTEKHEALAVTEDARKLMSSTGGTRMEVIYAEHSNRLKAMANEARKEAAHTQPTKYSPSANKAYANEVASLKAHINIAEKNAPLERQAQSIANSTVSQKRQANPRLEESEVKKIKQQALTEARVRTGAKKYMIPISQAEWDAIQAGAVSNNMMDKILKHTDVDTVKKLATPKFTPKMTSSKLLRAQAMLRSGFTQAEVANALGVGLTTLKTSLSE